MQCNGISKKAKKKKNKISTYRKGNDNKRKQSDICFTANCGLMILFLFNTVNACNKEKYKFPTA